MTAALTFAHLGAQLDQLRSSGPLVHCLTNTVVQNHTANTLLAAGAAPAMVDHPGEAAAFAAAASGVIINVGTVAPHQVESMPIAACAARDAAIPWVLDPVAVGFLPVRTELATTLLTLGPTAIRGNASEISALAGTGTGGRGVDSADSSEDALEPATALVERTGAVVAVSGPRDLIVWREGGEANSGTGIRSVFIAGGHPVMQQVVGTGCALGALTAAYLGAARSAPSGSQTADSRTAGAEPAASAFAVATAHAHAKAAGSIAARVSTAPGSFAAAWLDALATLTPEQLAQEITLD